MNLHRKLKVGLLAAAVALLLVNLILPFRIPLLKILITLGVAWAAWQWADPDKPHSHNAVFANERFRFSRGVNEERDENGTRVCRYVFSNAVLDLTDSSALPERIEIQAAFSNAVYCSMALPLTASIAASKDAKDSAVNHLASTFSASFSINSTLACQMASPS